MISPQDTITPKTASDVVGEMHDISLPISPITYHVWFGHRVGWYPDMTVEIERTMSRGEAISESFCEALYQKHISTDQRGAALNEAEEAARQLIESVHFDVQGSCGTASDYHSELNQYVERLGKASSADDVRDVVKGLVIQTSKMVSASDDLQQNLEQATIDIASLKQKMTLLEQENLLDALTGLNNRKALDHHLSSCFEVFETNGKSFCAMMLDVDHFKSFNDTYGHDVGDAVLRSVSSALTNTGHATATPHRYGGEEFCILVAECQLEEALQLADDIRQQIAGRQLKIARTGEKINPITISIGVALVTITDSPESLLQRADKALYLAKRSGRNNVKSERELTQESTGAHR